MELILRHGQGARTIELTEGTHLVGRDPHAAVHLPERQVSARHAELRVAGDRLFVQDLGSTNGTALDGVALPPEAGEREILPGSRVSFAGAVLERPIDELAAGAEQDGENGPGPLDTDREGFSAHGFYRPDEGYSQVAGARIAEMLSSLFELIASEGHNGAIEDMACEFVSRWVAADRVVMLVDSGEGTSLEKVGSWSVGGVSTENIQLSQTIVGRVMDQRTSVLLMDVQGATGGPSDSMLSLHLRSAMAVPLFDNRRVRGILYVDTARPGARYTNDELQVVTATANAVAVKLRNLSMEQEMATAARIQRALLPEKLPQIPGYELQVRLDMCRAVGGDLYAVVNRSDDHYLLALGDVAGKGMPAALAMSACMVLLSTLAEIGGAVDAIVNLINRKLWENLPQEQFVTLFLADLDPGTGKLTYVNAGHEPPLVSRAGRELEELLPTGPPAAMLPDCVWRVEQTVLAPGDFLAVFSDGIPEATLEGDRFMGLDAVRRILTEQRICPLKLISAAIVDEVRTFLRGNPASDDLTLMLVRRT